MTEQFNYGDIFINEQDKKVYKVSHDGFLYEILPLDKRKPDSYRKFLSPCNSIKRRVLFESISIWGQYFRDDKVWVKTDDFESVSSCGEIDKKNHYYVDELFTDEKEMINNYFEDLKNFWCSVENLQYAIDKMISERASFDLKVKGNETCFFSNIEY